jgi:hypothetical protein
MGSLSPWHWLILLVVFALIVAVIVGFVVLIVKLAKPKPANRYGVPRAPTASAPGWYPDPNDSNLVRYFDGRVWTLSTRPRAPTASAPGWYPDPNDSNLVRYFDGRVWTLSTRPRV